MKLAIMQPYFFPYLGYFQLINAVDTFVLYDNVQFTKKGWFNRNRLLVDNKVEYFTINLKKDSDFLDVSERLISPVYFEKEMPKTLRKIEQSYRKAPRFDEVYPFIVELFEFKESNLFLYLENALRKTMDFLDIKVKLVISSDLPLNHSLKNKWRVFDIYHHLGATQYINPSGGHDLYNKEDFADNNVNLNFLMQKLPSYNQFENEFIPGLSIIDVMMFNSKEQINNLLNQFKLK